MSEGQTCDQPCAWTDQQGDDFVPCPNTCAQPAGHHDGHHCAQHESLG
jgi:hypothetical protein